MGRECIFFEEDELRSIWSAPTTADGSVPAGESALSQDVKASSFEIVNLAVDRRMLVNRQRKLKMYRCWMQGRFRKVAPTSQRSPESATQGDEINAAPIE